MIYLDASVVVAALTQEARSDQVVEWLEARDSRSLAVSHWTRVEAASALSIKARRREITLDEHAEALRGLEILAQGWVNWHLVEPIAHDFDVAEHLTAQPALNLRGSDALHIAIALRHDWALATLDRDMRTAAARVDLRIEDVLPA